MYAGDTAENKKFYPSVGQSLSQAMYAGAVGKNARLLLHKVPITFSSICDKSLTISNAVLTAVY